MARPNCTGTARTSVSAEQEPAWQRATNWRGRARAAEARRGWPPPSARAEGASTWTRDRVCGGEHACACTPGLAPADFLVDFNIHSVRARKGEEHCDAAGPHRAAHDAQRPRFEKWREGRAAPRGGGRGARARKVFHVVVHRAVRDGLDGWIAHRDASRAAERTDAALRELDDWWQAAIMAPVRQAEEAEDRNRPRGTYFSQALRSSVLV